MQEQHDSIRQVVPAATPYGTNPDGSPFEGWKPAIESYPAPKYVDPWETPDYIGGGSVADGGEEYLGVPITKEPEPPEGYYRVVLPIKTVQIPACGHSFRPGFEPAYRNCAACWFTFFQTHGEVTKTATELFHDYGEAGVTQVRGKKFAKNFIKFMATLAQWKKLMDSSTEVESTDVIPDIDREHPVAA